MFNLILQRIGLITPKKMKKTFHTFYFGRFLRTERNWLRFAGLEAKIISVSFVQNKCNSKESKIAETVLKLYKRHKGQIA